MKKGSPVYGAYIRILNAELVPAMGCTEPIAVAYACARAREALGALPERVDLWVSGNIIKNVKSVVVPNTGGKKGIEASAGAGIVAADPNLMLECLSVLNANAITEIDKYMSKNVINVFPADTGRVFDIHVNVYAGNDAVYLRIADGHTNIVHISKNGETMVDIPVCDSSAGDGDEALLSVEDVVDFADSVDIEDVREVLSRQIELNTAISEEGLRHEYGACIGRVLLNHSGGDKDVKTRAKAKAAAGSDARMGGCELPVVIVAGSGNQGIAASVPVIEYARELGVSEDRLYRALVISNLLTIHQKTGIGRLSAFCGAVNAGCGAAAAVSYLYGGGFTEIAHTLVNSLAVVSGMVCDGAKPSCAAKIAAALDAGLLGFYMYQDGYEFLDGDGIIRKGVENTLVNIGRLGKSGMYETDKEILRMMTE